MCQCSFTDCNKGATLVGDVDNGGGFAGVGAGGLWENLCTFCSILL